MTSASTSMTSFHVPARQLISCPPKQRLRAPIASSQAVEANLLLVYIHFAAHQTMTPVATDLILAAQHDDLPALIAATDVDDLSFHFCLIVALPLAGKLPPRGRAVAARGFASARRRHIARRLLLQPGEAGVLESRPHFGWPQPIVAFNPVLQAVLPGRRKHRRHAEIQTDPDHLADNIRVVMRSGKAGVIVELRIVGQADLAPMLENGCQSRLGGVGRRRKRAHQMTMQGNDIANFDLDAAPNEQPLDEVEFIQLRQAVGDLRQVPALGWRTTTNSSSVIQRPIALKDTTDGAQRRQGASPATAKLGADGDRAKLAEITLLFKLFAKRQHALLDFRRNAIGNLSRRAR